MMLLPSKLLSSSHTSFTTIKPTHHPPFRCLIAFSTSSSSSSSSPTPHFMVDYLVASCGLNPDKADEASKHLTRIKSPSQPNAVLHFFRTRGFNDNQIATLISLRPRCLTYDVEKTLQPRFHALQNLGFSPSDTPHFILSTPDVLNSNFTRTVLPKIELWISLLGSTNCLMKFLRQDQWILGYSVAKTIIPNLALLRDCGIVDKKISMVVKHHPRFILQKPSTLKVHIDMVEGLGIPRQSGMFIWALQAVRMVSGDRFKAKLELMMSLGWSELEFLAAFRRAPVFLSVSEVMMRKKMDFLVNEAGCEPSYLALRPVLLMYSLEKRLIPRFRVMKILKARGLRGSEHKLHTIMDYTEKKFIQKFIICHKKEVPQLYQLYITDRGVEIQGFETEAEEDS